MVTLTNVKIVENKALYTDEQAKGTLTSFVAGSIANFANVIAQNNGLSPAISTLIFQLFGGNALGYFLDLIFAKNRNGVSRTLFLGKQIASGSFQRFWYTVIIDSLISLQMNRFLIDLANKNNFATNENPYETHVSIGIFIGLCTWLFLANVLYKLIGFKGVIIALMFAISIGGMIGINKPLVTEGTRNSVIAFITAVITFVVYVNILRFEWAYLEKTDPLSDFIIHAWMTILLVIFVLFPPPDILPSPALSELKV